jgi:hypothetical protein
MEGERVQPLISMTRDETLARLRDATLGRVAVSVQALPYVFLAGIRLVEPVGEQPTIVVAVDPATVSFDALRHAVVAVHTDGTDLSGVHWQALVQGLSTLREPLRTDGYSTRPPSNVDEAIVCAELVRGWRRAAP